jgi:pSer/pThr/pTyr-binding forkhead associated (FHA) protein
MARLILESGGERREYGVSDTLTLGRSKSNPIVLEDRLLSRKHAELAVEQAPDGRTRYFLKDLESKNGTYLNGQLIRRREPIKHGDRIRIGDFIFRFIMEAGERSPSRPPAPLVKQKKKEETRVPLPGRKAPASASPIAKPIAASGAATDDPPTAVYRTARKASGAGSFGKFVFNSLLLGVFAAGTYGSKILFVWVLNRTFAE